MSNDTKVDGWKACQAGAKRSENPHGPEAKFRDWQEGFDQCGAQSQTSAERRKPLGMPAE